MTDTTTREAVGRAAPLEPVPWRPVLLLGAGVIALLLTVAPRYGWHRDELYFLAAGRHLDWGYIDQPPFTPLVARMADLIAPGNLVVLRTLPALTTAVTILLGAFIVRELGGGRNAQIAGAAALAAGGFVLGVGHLLSTAAFDLTAWLALLWLVARLLRTGDPRWWLAAGGVAGLSMLNKNLIVLLGASIAAGLLAERRWDLLITPWLAAGGAVAIAIAAPNLLWQATNDWPQVEMARVLADRLATENRITLVPLQVLFAGPLLMGVLVTGARRLARDPAASRFRPLLWAWGAGLVLVFATGGRPYYVLPLTTVVLLAGIPTWVQPGTGRRLAWLITVNAIVSVPLGLPLLPIATTSVTATVNEAVAETVGWPELVDQVAVVVGGLPAPEQGGVVLLASNYGEAGAIDRFGPSRGLPPAHSPHNSYADFRQPVDEQATVVAVGFPDARLAPHFERCTVVDTIDNGRDVDNEEQGRPIHVCRGLRRTWPEVWEELRFLS